MAHEEKPKEPRYWEKRVLAAYLLMMGEGWVSTCSKIGRSQTTLSVWKRETETWERAKAEAERRWMYDLKDVSRRAVYHQIKKGDGDLGLKVLERTVADLAPPAQKQDIDVAGRVIFLSEKALSPEAWAEQHGNGHAAHLLDADR